jgi:tetratricopeptide (TPR) repeat protein
MPQFEKALGLDQDYFPTHNYMAYAYVAMGDYGKAEEHFKIYRNLVPQEANPCDYMKALEASDAVIRLARGVGMPGEAALLHLGKCAIHCELKNYAAAGMSIAKCRKALSDPAAPPDAKQNTGVAASFWEVFVAAQRKEFAGAEAKLADLKGAIAKTNEPFLANYAGADAQFAKVKAPDPFFIYYAALAKEKAGDAAGAKTLYAKVANWNEDTLWYAFVRNKAKAKV